MDLYYNNATSDNQWDTIGNWWLDSIYTFPASGYGLPQTGDTVNIDGELSTGPSTPVVLGSIQCGFYNSSSFGVNLGDATTNGGYAFYNNVTHTGTTVFGSYYFYDNSINSGSIDSNNQSGGFYNNSQNAGTATGDTGFINNSQNTGTCNNDATFTNSSYNSGVVVGDATFQTFSDLGGGAYEDTLGYGIGTVNGNVVGNTGAISDIQYAITLTGDIIATTASFQVSFYTPAYIDSNSVVNILGDVYFNGTSYNAGEVVGDAHFVYINVVDGIGVDITGYSSGVVGGVVYGASSAVITTWRFTGDFLNSATCTGNAIFDGAGGIYGSSGTVTGDASFYNGANNGGTVQGTTFIYDDSRNTGTVEDIIYKSAEATRLAIQNGDIGTINGTVSLPFADILGTGLQ